MNWRRIEQEIVQYLKSNKIDLGADGLGGAHFVIVRKAAAMPTNGTRLGLPTECPLCVQVGERCGFEHERVRIEDLAKFLAENAL